MPHAYYWFLGEKQTCGCVHMHTFLWFLLSPRYKFVFFQTGHERRSCRQKFNISGVSWNIAPYRIALTFSIFCILIGCPFPLNPHRLIRWLMGQEASQVANPTAEHWKGQTHLHRMKLLSRDMSLEEGGDGPLSIAGRTKESHQLFPDAIILQWCCFAVLP